MLASFSLPVLCCSVRRVVSIPHATGPLAWTDSVFTIPFFVMMGERPRLDHFRPVFSKCFSGRENPWKMSVSWFLIEVATPEESGFSLETRCQGKCSKDLQRTSAGCLEPSGQWIWCGAVLLPYPSFPPELEEPRGSDITTCMSLGLSVKCKQFPGWQGGCWNYILGFQSSGTSEAQGPGWPLEWALFYTSGNFIEQSTLLSQRVGH